MMISVLTTPSAVAGQPWLTEGEIGFWVDAVPFKGIGEKTGLEVVYRGGADQLTFQDQGEEFRAWACFSIEVRSSDGDTASKQWATPVGALDESQTASADMYVVESLVADLPPGPATITTSVRDSLSGREGVVSGQVEIPSYADSSLAVSGIILASRVEKGGQGPFQKGGFAILPEPSRRFGPFQPVLYVYHETYNLTCADSAGGPASSEPRFSVGYSVLNSEGTALKVLRPDTLVTPGPHAARVAGLSVAGLSQGEYLLRVSVEDLITGQRADEATTFWVVEQRPGGSPARVAALSDEERTLSEEDAELLEALVTYLGTAEEKSLYKGLSEGAQASFLAEFAQRRLTSRWPTVQAYLDEQRERLQHVNAEFGGFRRGWKSDPGRVYIQYGPPDEIERYAAQTDRKDHQIWRYYSMGGVLFIFVDESGYGSYRLVHSTAKGELRSPDWRKEVFVLPTW
jgi:GWxTD domain-containing protein